MTRSVAGQPGVVTIGTGNTVGQIAQELVLGVKTISTYRSRVLEKMSLSNNAELTRYALENQLLD